MGFVDNDLYDLLKINKFVIAVVVMLAVGSGGWRAPVCLDRPSDCWGGVAGSNCWDCHGLYKHFVYVCQNYMGRRYMKVWEKITGT